MSSQQNSPTPSVSLLQEGAELSDNDVLEIGLAIEQVFLYAGSAPREVVHRKAGERAIKVVRAALSQYQQERGGAGYERLKAEMLRYVACNEQTQDEVFLRFRAKDKTTWTRAEFVEALRNDEPVALDMMLSMMGVAADLIARDAQHPDRAATPVAIEEGGGTQWVRVKEFSQIEDGSTLLVLGNLNDVPAHLFFNVQKKCSEQDGQEVILKKKGNIYFNFGMYVRGASWVKDCFIQSFSAHDAR